MSKPRSGKAIIRAMIDLYKTHGWTQGVYARDSHGKHVNVHSDEATCFCLEGSLIRAADEASDRVYNCASSRIELLCGGDVAAWNDAPGRTKRQVLAMLRRAAA